MDSSFSLEFSGTEVLSSGDSSYLETQTALSTEPRVGVLTPVFCDGFLGMTMRGATLLLTLDYQTFMF